MRLTCHLFALSGLLPTEGTCSVVLEVGAVLLLLLILWMEPLLSLYTLNKWSITTLTQWIFGVLVPLMWTFMDTECPRTALSCCKPFIGTTRTLCKSSPLVVLLGYVLNEISKGSPLVKRFPIFIYTQNKHSLSAT